MFFYKSYFKYPHECVTIYQAKDNNINYPVITLAELSLLSGYSEEAIINKMYEEGLCIEIINGRYIGEQLPF